MSVGDFEAIVGSNFPQFTPPKETTQEAFDAVLGALPRPLSIIDNDMVRVGLVLPTDDEIQVFVHAEKVTVLPHGEEHVIDDIAVEFTYEDEELSVSADDFDMGTDPETAAETVDKLRWLLASISDDDPYQAWLDQVLSGLTADSAFRPFIIRELLDDPAVELDVSQQWMGGYLFNNGTHLALAAEVPIETSYPPLPETVEPIDLQIALTLPNRMHYVYQRFKGDDGEGYEEQMAWFPDVRQLTLPRYNDSDIPVSKDAPVVSEADVWIESELASDRAKPSDQLMRRMTRAMQRALRSGIRAVGPLELVFDEK
ncbi:MAG: hypothetical protein ACREGB_02360 [Candidatus Saccharimonadales bacterium]